MKTKIWMQSTCLKRWVQELESSLCNYNGNSAMNTINATEGVLLEIESYVNDIKDSLRDLKERVEIHNEARESSIRVHKEAGLITQRDVERLLGNM